jgi:hypothetical protein
MLPPFHRSASDASEPAGMPGPGMPDSRMPDVGMRGRA